MGHTIDRVKLVEDMTTGFFQYLTETFNDYFLSDCIHEIDADPQVVQDLVEVRDLLKAKCDKYGINFHYLSFQVADKYLRKVGILPWE